MKMLERHLAESNSSKYIMEYSQNILANDPKRTVNKLYRKRTFRKMRSDDLTMIFPSKHEGSNDAVKALIDTNKDSLMTNNDNYMYSYTHCYGNCFISEQNIQKSSGSYSNISSVYL